MGSPLEDLDPTLYLYIYKLNHIIQLIDECDCLFKSEYMQI